MELPIRFEPLSCAICGALFALTAQHVELLKQTSLVWYCPNGHMQTFVKPSTETSVPKSAEGEKK